MSFYYIGTIIASTYSHTYKIVRTKESFPLIMNVTNKVMLNSSTFINIAIIFNDRTWPKSFRVPFHRPLIKHQFGYGASAQRFTLYNVRTHFFNEKLHKGMSENKLTKMIGLWSCSKFMFTAPLVNNLTVSNNQTIIFLGTIWLILKS